MAVNPFPTHITMEMWWFIEQLELLEGPDTVFSGSWGRVKPGYHNDYWELWNHKVNGVFVWRNDYSISLPEDKVGGTPLEQFGAAVDWTFKSAQAGDSRNIRKYGARIRTAWLKRDPRLKGWREVLTQGDGDPQADGYDFVNWTERTPDFTHTWHFHFSCLRKYLRTLSVFHAMLSILRGETLAQWLVGGDEDDMAKVFWYGTDYWVAVGGKREVIKDADDMAKVLSIYPGSQYPGVDAGKIFPAPNLATVGWSEDEVDRLLGRKYAPGNPGSGEDGTGSGASPEQVRVIVHDELTKLKLASDLE